MLSALMAAKVLIGYNQPFVLLEAITIVKVNFSLLRIFTLSILEQSVLEEVVLSLLLNGLILLLPADMHGMSPPLMLLIIILHRLFEQLLSVSNLISLSLSNLHLLL